MIRKLATILLILTFLAPALAGAAQVDITKYAAIRPGMTAGEVEYRLGPPNVVHGTAWISYWHYRPDPGEQQILTVIEFWNGRVHAKERVYM